MQSSGSKEDWRSQTRQKARNKDDAHTVFTKEFLNFLTPLFTHDEFYETGAKKAAPRKNQRIANHDSEVHENHAANEREIILGGEEACRNQNDVFGHRETEAAKDQDSEKDPLGPG